MKCEPSTGVCSLENHKVSNCLIYKGKKVKREDLSTDHANDPRVSNIWPWKPRMAWLESVTVVMTTRPSGLATRLCHCHHECQVVMTTRPSGLATSHSTSLFSVISCHDDPAFGPCDVPMLIPAPPARCHDDPAFGPCDALMVFDTVTSSCHDDPAFGPCD